MTQSGRQLQWSRLSRRRLLALLSALSAWMPLSRPFAVSPGDGDTVQVDLSKILPGEILRVDWGDKPIFIRHRTVEEIERARMDDSGRLPDPEADKERVKRPNWLVVVGLCTHGGCIPKGPLGRFGGWYCLCHGSQFDTSGRVRIGPARDNLEVPPYRFVGEDRIVIGEPAS